MDGLSLDAGNLESALLLVESATGRSMEESLNRAALHTVIGSGGYKGAMQLTPKADAAKIASVSNAQLAGYVIAKAKRTGKWPMRNVDIQREVRKERARRQRAKGYTANVGWSNASKAFGGRGVGVSNKGDAAKGYGKKANTFDLTAEIANTAPMSEKLGTAPLQEALDNAAKDLEEYAHRKMQQNFDKVK